MSPPRFGGAAEEDVEGLVGIVGSPDAVPGGGAEGDPLVGFGGGEEPAFPETIFRDFV
jgi:hypothetical protein